MNLWNVFELKGPYYVRDGTAKDRGLQNLCRKNLCLYSNNKETAFNMMYELSHAHDCYEVKVSKDGRGGIYIGHCYFTNENSLGDAWAKYELHPYVRVSIQDDDFYALFKSNIRTYK